MKQTKLTIGLFGFGVVGEGLYQVLQKTPSLQAQIKKICIKHPDKKRSAPPGMFTTRREDILNDKEINVVVELIDDAGEAFKIVRSALKKKKAVVSANKKMIAEHASELLQLQKEFAVPLLYEAAVCGSIPIIRNLEEYYDNDLLHGICGIVNGSTNFMLTKIFEDKIDYSKALSLAQQFGFAESDPTLDVEGIDAVNKLTILLLHGYGIISSPQELLHIGISRIHSFDATKAREKNWQIKLCAQAKKLSGGIAAFVLPQFVPQGSQLFSVHNEYNGVVLQSALADKQFLYGKGAGRYPTSSAVLSDLSALRYHYRYEYRKQGGEEGTARTDHFYVRLYVSFNYWNEVAVDDFEWIEEFHCHEQRQYFIGVIHFEKLKNASWIHKKEVSVIVCPDGILEDIGYQKVREKSLALAGTIYVDKTKETMDHLLEEVIFR